MRTWRQTKNGRFNGEGDNPPIGIILTLHKNELLVEYATYKMNSQLFVQKYQLYLPDREELCWEIETHFELPTRSSEMDMDRRKQVPRKRSEIPEVSEERCYL